jgi:hypothetical protein
VDFRNDRLHLRRYDAQISYHAAYLFWNLRGLLAEKWAHGPIFGAYGIAEDAISLSPAAEEASRVVQTPTAIYGLRASGLLWEMTDRHKATELANDWLKDCHEALQPRRVTRTYVRFVYSYPLTEDELPKVAGAFDRAYTPPALPPGDYEESYSATQFQARSMDGATNILTTGIFGPYAPDQARGLFQTVVPQDKQWALSLIFDRTTTLEVGFNNVNETIRNALKVADDESWQLVARTLVKVIEDA